MFRIRSATYNSTNELTHPRSRIRTLRVPYAWLLNRLFAYGLDPCEGKPNMKISSTITEQSIAKRRWTFFGQFWKVFRNNLHFVKDHSCESLAIFSVFTCPLVRLATRASPRKYSLYPFRRCTRTKMITILILHFGHLIQELYIRSLALVTRWTENTSQPRWQWPQSYRHDFGALELSNYLIRLRVRHGDWKLKNIGYKTDTHKLKITAHTLITNVEEQCARIISNNKISEGRH